jgi:hypothetical protein
MTDAYGRTLFRQEPPARTMTCPICGNELGMMSPEATHAWTPQQRLLLHKLEQFGFGSKLLARVFGIKPQSIAQAQFKERRRLRQERMA